LDEASAVNDSIDIKRGNKREDQEYTGVGGMKRGRALGVDRFTAYFRKTDKAKDDIKGRLGKATAAHEVKMDTFLHKQLPYTTY